MSEQILNVFGVPEITSGTASTTAQQWTPAKTISGMEFVNAGDTNDLLFNFDNGSTWHRVLPNTKSSYQGHFQSVYFKTVEGQTAYSALV